MLLNIHQENRLLRLTLNRPEKRNALNLALCRDLVNALDHADTDPSVGAILLTGNGKAFCAGMDLSEVLQANVSDMDQVHERLFTIGYRLRKPIVAGIQGPALAGGAGLAANAHVVVACEGAMFGLTEIRIGLWPFLIFRAMKAAIGERRATELALTGRIFDGRQACAYGLVSEVCQSPVNRAEEISLQLSQSSTDAIGAGLDYVHRTRDKSWDEAGRIGWEIRRPLMASDGFKERVGRALASHKLGI